MYIIRIKRNECTYKNCIFILNIKKEAYALKSEPRLLHKMLFTFFFFYYKHAVYSIKSYFFFLTVKNMYDCLVFEVISRYPLLKFIPL